MFVRDKCILWDQNNWTYSKIIIKFADVQGVHLVQLVMKFKPHL